MRDSLDMFLHTCEGYTGSFPGLLGFVSNQLLGFSLCEQPSQGSQLKVCLAF